MYLSDYSWLWTFLRLCIFDLGISFYVNCLVIVFAYFSITVVFYSLLICRNFLYYILTFCKWYTCKTSFLFHLMYIDFVQRYGHWIESLNTDFIKFIPSSHSMICIFIFCHLLTLGLKDTCPHFSLLDS